MSKKTLWTGNLKFRKGEETVNVTVELVKVIEENKNVLNKERYFAFLLEEGNTKRYSYFAEKSSVHAFKILVKRMSEVDPENIQEVAQAVYYESPTNKWVMKFTPQGQQFTLIFS